MQTKCQHVPDPQFVCGHCSNVLYCGQECADTHWRQGHFFECIGGKRGRRRRKMIVPNQEQLDWWTDQNLSGWERGTIPRRWPSNWIYNDNYFPNYWPELETYDVVVVLNEDEEEEEEEEEEEWMSVTPPPPREYSDNDSVPGTAIVPERPRFCTPPSIKSEKKKLKTKKTLNFTE